MGLAVFGEAVGTGGVGAAVGLFVGDGVGRAVVGLEIGCGAVGLGVVGLGVGCVISTNGIQLLLHVDPAAQLLMVVMEFDEKPDAELIEEAIMSVSSGARK